MVEENWKLKIVTKIQTIVGLTPGCEEGVGPELLVRAMIACDDARVRYVWCGDHASLALACMRAGVALARCGKDRAMVNQNVFVEFNGDDFHGDHLQRQAQFLQMGVQYASQKRIDALVTGPVNKAALLHLPDAPCGQTEFLATLSPEKNPMMVFTGGPFVLSLVTTHMPLNRVSPALTFERVFDHLTTVAKHAVRVCKKPHNELRLAILGLNPHAGEQGLLGFEEQEVIIPAMVAAQKTGLNIVGPLAADGFFAYLQEPHPDVVVAMYHDQGLIPYKLIAKGKGVNVTFGLTIPRTSPAHGTATHLTGKNLAEARSTIEAIKTAVALAAT